jgi:simple sugar transport system permease protein
MSRAADVPTYIADMLLALSLLFMVLAVLLARFRVVRG